MMDDDYDSPFSCPMCGCGEVGWAATMGVEFVACSCRACGLMYMITREEVECASD